MPFDATLQDSLVERITELIGRPIGVTKKMYRWKRGSFEVALDAENGPSVWLPARWAVNSAIPAGLRHVYYSAGRARHSNLNSEVPDLADGDAYHVFPESSQLELVVTCIRDCAASAGAI